MKGRAESYGHKAEKDKERSVPIVGIDCMHIHREQEREEEKGMPILVVKGGRTKMVVSEVVTNKGVVDYTVGLVKKMIEQLGYKKILLRSDN